MKLRTRTWATAAQADTFEVPQGARNFRIHPSGDGSIVATWYEPDPEDIAWGSTGVMHITPSVLGLEHVASTCRHCNASEHDCAPLWESGRRCCGRCEHGVCRLMGRPHRAFRPKGIALLGVVRGTKIQRLRVGTMHLGEGAEPMAAELLQPVGPVVVDKLGELGIAELGELGGMTGTESVGKLLEVLQAHTPFVCRAFNWPTAHPGMDILLELEGYCRGAILWGLSAFDVRPSEGDPR